MSVTARKHRLGGLYLRSKDRQLWRNISKKISHHEFQGAEAQEERRLQQGQLWQQKLEFREAHQQSLTEMEELRKFQSFTFDTTARRKLIKDQNTILELSGRVQELQNEVNCMNDSKDFQDAESVRGGNSTLPINRGYSLNIMSTCPAVSSAWATAAAATWKGFGQSAQPRVRAGRIGIRRCCGEDGSQSHVGACQGRSEGSCTAESASPLGPQTKLWNMPGSG